jgi:hypothetical protein
MGDREFHPSSSRLEIAPFGRKFVPDRQRLTHEFYRLWPRWTRAGRAESKYNSFSVLPFPYCPSHSILSSLTGEYDVPRPSPSDCTLIALLTECVILVHSAQFVPLAVVCVPIQPATTDIQVSIRRRR